MNIKQAKAIPLEDVLQRLGHTPERRGQNQLWYLSPFRIETTPSFKVDPDANSFWDFGEGKGGDALDLIQRIEGLPKVADALARLERLFGNGPPPPCVAPAKKSPPAPAAPELIRTQPVHARSLRAYLKQRGIDPTIAVGTVKEVHYRAKGKDYFALGLLNDSGGYELRNPFWKGSLGSKDITTIPGDSRRVSVFEGLFDYLTALQLSGRALNDTVIVLNSVSLAERAIARIRELDAERINVYRDHDAAGERLLESFAKALPTATIVDKSDAYPGYCDLNEGYLAARKSGKACAAI